VKYGAAKGAVRFLTVSSQALVRFNSSSTGIQCSGVTGKEIFDRHGCGVGRSDLKHLKLNHLTEILLELAETKRTSRCAPLLLAPDPLKDGLNKLVWPVRIIDWLR
jgi:hypothetical protein